MISFLLQNQKRQVGSDTGIETALHEDIPFLTNEDIGDVNAIQREALHFLETSQGMVRMEILSQPVIPAVCFSHQLLAEIPG